MVFQRKKKLTLQKLNIFLPIFLDGDEVRMADDEPGSGEETSLLSTFDLDEERLAEFRDYVKRRDANL